MGERRWRDKIRERGRKEVLGDIGERGEVSGCEREKVERGVIGDRGERLAQWSEREGWNRRERSVRCDSWKRKVMGEVEEKYKRYIERDVRELKERESWYVIESGEREERSVIGESWGREEAARMELR